MGNRKSRRVSKMEVPTDTPTEFELGDTAADIQRRREESEVREEGRGTETDGGIQEGVNYTLSTRREWLKSVQE